MNAVRAHWMKRCLADSVVRWTDRLMLLGWTADG